MRHSVSLLFYLARPLSTPCSSVPTFHAKQVFPHLPFLFVCNLQERSHSFQEYARNAPSLRDWQLQLRLSSHACRVLYIEKPGCAVCHSSRTCFLPPIHRAIVVCLITFCSISGPSHNRTACDYPVFFCSGMDHGCVGPCSPLW